MSGLRRAFLAVVPPATPRAWAESAAHAAELIAPDLRWSRPEQRHLTMQFLGAVPDVAPVAEFVADAARRRKPFTLSLGGGGAFPNARRASVLWLGVRHGSDELTDLAMSLSSLTSEDRPYRPHLTLARVTKSRDLREVVAVLDACGTSDLWTVEDLVLFESDGSTHTEQARFRLAG